MPLESGTFVGDLVTTNPPGTDVKQQGDDHLRLVKTVLKNTFPNATKVFRFPEVTTKVFADSPYSLVAADNSRLLQVNATDGLVTINLLAAATAGNGFRFEVIKSDASTNTVVIDPSGAELINGATTLVLREPFEGAIVWCDGSTWFAHPIRLDINGLAEETTVDLANDFIVMYDASAGRNRKVRLNKISSPIGMMADFAGTSAPAGWLLAFGQAISRTTFAALFDVIGTIYGAGDGSTTFNLPDARGYVTAGKDDMGGVSANRLAFDATILGATGGEATHVLTPAEGPIRNHIHGGYNTVNISIAGGGSTLLTLNAGPPGATDSPVGGEQSGAPHNITQPTLIFNKMIFAGA